MKAYFYFLVITYTLAVVLTVSITGPTWRTLGVLTVVGVYAVCRITMYMNRPKRS